MCKTRANSGVVERSTERNMKTKSQSREEAYSSVKMQQERGEQRQPVGAKTRARPRHVSRCVDE